MSGHLSEGEIDQYLAGERRDSAEQHLAICAACRAEVSRMESALALFRVSVRAWSEEQLPLPVAAPHRSRAIPRWAAIESAYGATAILATVMIAGFSAWRYSHPLPPPPISDAALLDQIASEIAQPAPAEMAPLLVCLDAVEARKR